MGVNFREKVPGVSGRRACRLEWLPTVPIRFLHHLHFRTGAQESGFPKEEYSASHSVEWSGRRFTVALDQKFFGSLAGCEPVSTHAVDGDDVKVILVERRVEQVFGR